MIVRQEFVAIPVEGGVRVYGVPDFPLGTPSDPTRRNSTSKVRCGSGSPIPS